MLSFFLSFFLSFSPYFSSGRVLGCCTGGFWSLFVLDLTFLVLFLCFMSRRFDVILWRWPVSVGMFPLR
jgi:hypothetical protein